MKDVYSYKDCDIVVGTLPLSIKDIDGRKGIVTGYFANFDSIDSDGDIIKKGAFVKSISEQGPLSSKPRVKHLLNHDPSQPLGLLKELKEDNFGLYYESQLGTHDLGVDFVKMVDSGLITEHSIGYRTIKYNQIKPWADWKEGEAMRELTELKLYEGSSLTAWGANKNTPLTGMKSEQKADAMVKRMDLIIKAIRNGTLTDETCDMLEIELKQIQQLFIDLTKEQKQPPVQGTEEPATATHPTVVKSRNWGSLTQLLN
jgi:HK97 family phage prohead protease